MEIKLGRQIARLRKERGMTQEQLAQAVGVSPPAVSKWETDSSCPDIALLCPLARALSTNVDTLLQFEDELPEDRMMDSMNEILDNVMEKGYEEAEVMLKNLLHSYPSSISLKFHAAVALDMIMLTCMSAGKEKRTEWTGWKKQLLEEIYRSGDAKYWLRAVSGLAGIAIGEDRLDDAETLLKKLPDQTDDPPMMWTMIHLKREEPEQALETIQKALYATVTKVQRYLMQMMNEKVMPDPEKVLEICKIYGETEKLFGVGGGLGIGFYIQAYQRMNNMEETKKYMIQMIDLILGPARMPNPLLFHPTLKVETDQAAVPKQVKEYLLNNLLTSDDYKPFRGDQDFKEAVERLRRNIEECSEQDTAT